MQFLIIVVFVGIFVLAPIEARTHTMPLMIIVLVGNGNILSRDWLYMLCLQKKSPRQCLCITEGCLL
ncbi:hypothetical protein HQ45_09605 [Porphyromonas crevioricanis]|nr:hypothetical protein HQ45_09605 [Porphyromonas crevioricanis]